MNWVQTDVAVGCVQDHTQRTLPNEAVDCVDHKQGPNRELDQIPVENPVSITGGSGTYPDRQIHRQFPDNYPARQRLANDVALLRLSRRQAPVVLLGQARGAVASTVVLDEVRASGLALSVDKDDGHLGFLGLPFLLLRLLRQ